MIRTIPQPPHGLYDAKYLFRVSSLPGHPLRCLCCLRLMKTATAESLKDHAEGCPARVLLRLQYRVVTASRLDDDDPWDFHDAIEAPTFEAAALSTSELVGVRSNHLDVSLGFTEPELDKRLIRRAHELTEARWAVQRAQQTALHAESERGRLMQNREQQMRSLAALKRDLTPAAYERRRRLILNAKRYADLPEYKPTTRNAKP